MYDKGRSSLSTDGLIRIRVLGEPRTFPSKVFVTKDKYGNPLPNPRMTDADHQTRKNPITGEPEKYNRGYKRKWMAHIAASVDTFMFDKNLEPFPKRHPLAVGYFFFLTKAKTCKLDFPSQDPDYDNLEYAVNNALKNTVQTKKGRTIQGKYPDGVLFHDDNQPVWRIKPDGMFWADEMNPPGLLISCRSAYDLRDEILKYVTPKAGVLL